jgi:hypothetical protein
VCRREIEEKKAEKRDGLTCGCGIEVASPCSDEISVASCYRQNYDHDIQSSVGKYDTYKCELKLFFSQDKTCAYRYGAYLNVS